MPYIHPDLGVPCMTISEFWAAESKAENKPAHELIDDFYGEIAADEQRARQNIINDKSGALKLLQDYYDPEYCDSDFTPTEVISITDATVNYSMRSSTTTFTAIVKCSDNKVRTLEYTETQYSGSYMEPPDFDSNCRIISE